MKQPDRHTDRCYLWGCIVGTEFHHVTDIMDDMMRKLLRAVDSIVPTDEW